MIVKENVLIHPGAQIGENVHVEPFVTIAKDVVIGDNTWIGPHVTILNGVRIGDNCRIFPGSVIGGIPQDLKYKGDDVKEGMLIPKGSPIDIHLCDGFGNTRQLIPDLFGKSLLEAKLILEAYSLVLGSIEIDGSVKDSLSSFVYYQSPPHDGESTMRMGEAVDVYVTQNKPNIQ